jgi:hypothetical protein
MRHIQHAHKLTAATTRHDICTRVQRSRSRTLIIAKQAAAAHQRLSQCSVCTMSCCTVYTRHMLLMLQPLQFHRATECRCCNLLQNIHTQIDIRHNHTRHQRIMENNTIQTPRSTSPASAAARAPPAAVSRALQAVPPAPPALWRHWLWPPHTAAHCSPPAGGSAAALGGWQIQGALDAPTATNAAASSCLGWCYN